MMKERLKITKPCFENWNEFTPTQQGAFCSKCQINVKDFTNMSNQDIKTYLDENRGKHLCGRFDESQINNFNNDFYLWQTGTLPSHQSKFIFVLLVVFGMTLFSCATPSQQSHIESLAKIVNTDLLSQQVVEEKPQIDSSLVVDLPPTKQNKANLYDLPIIDKDGAMCGGTVSDTLKNNQNKSKAERKIIPDMFKVYSKKVMGMMVYTNPEGKVAEVEKDTVKPKSEMMADNELVTNVFPNPTTGGSTLEINVEKEGFYHINITNLNGEILQTLYSGNYQKGQYRLNIDLFDFPNGLYLLSVQTSTQHQTLKIVKQN